MATFNGEVHPVADLFPMLADDELADLANDIATNGLLQPLVLDVEGRLLDGRNRLAACQLADMEPEFTVYDGPAPDAYALSVNIARRHLTKGQQAMVAARAARMTGQSVRSLSEQHDVSTGRISMSNAVLDHAPDMADAVVSGAASLNEAYDTARERKKAAESTEAKLAKLRAEAPDLADLVTEERMTLAEAVAAAKQRADERDARIRSALDGTCDALVRLITILGPNGGIDRVADNWRPETTRAWQVEPNQPLLSIDGIHEAADLLNTLALTLEKCP